MKMSNVKIKMNSVNVNEALEEERSPPCKMKKLNGSLFSFLPQVFSVAKACFWKY